MSVRPLVMDFSYRNFLGMLEFLEIALPKLYINLKNVNL